MTTFTLESDDKTRVVHATYEYVCDDTYRVYLKSPLPKGAFTLEETITASTEAQAQQACVVLAKKQLQILLLQCLPADPARYGYHEILMPKGKVGEISKIVEEALEAWDADQQGNPIMTLVELSDLLGAVQSYLSQHHPSMTLQDVLKMSEVTQRAFKHGRR